MENRIVQLIENLNILTKSIFYFLAFLFISTTYTFANSPEVTAVRIGGDENKTRFVLEINNDIRVKDLAGFCVGHFNFITLKKAVRVEDLIEDRNLLFCDSEALFIPSDAEVVGWFEYI